VSQRLVLGCRSGLTGLGEDRLIDPPNVQLANVATIHPPRHFGRRSKLAVYHCAAEALLERARVATASPSGALTALDRPHGLTVRGNSAWRIAVGAQAKRGA